MSVSATSTEGLLASETIPAQELTGDYICNPTPVPRDHFVFRAGKSEETGVGGRDGRVGVEGGNGDVVLLLQCSPSLHRALSLIPNTA